jgi:hypothetical protein
MRKQDSKMKSRLASDKATFLLTHKDSNLNRQNQNL